MKKKKRVELCCAQQLIFLGVSVSLSINQGQLSSFFAGCDEYVSTPCEAVGTGLASGSSVQFSPSVMSDSLRPLGQQHARLPCPSPTPRVHSNSCPIELVIPSNHLILCRPLLLLSSIFLRFRILWWVPHNYF